MLVGLVGHLLAWNHSFQLLVFLTLHIDIILYAIVRFLLHSPYSYAQLYYSYSQ